MEMSEILKIVDIDQRVQAIKYAKNGIREFYLSQKGEKIDEYVKSFLVNGLLEQIKYELWKIPQGEIFNKEVYFALYECPSAKKRGEVREYTKGVPEFKTIAEAMSWGMGSNSHVVSPEEWKQMIPLINES